MGSLTILVTLIGLAIFVVLLAFLGFLLMAAMKLLKGESTRHGRRARMQEAQMVQEIYHGLSRMEKRVEALETILLDRARKEDSESVDH